MHLLCAVQVSLFTQFKHCTGLCSITFFSAFSGTLGPNPFEFGCFPGLLFSSFESLLFPKKSSLYTVFKHPTLKTLDQSWDGGLLLVLLSDFIWDSFSATFDFRIAFSCCNFWISSLSCWFCTDSSHTDICTSSGKSFKEFNMTSMI